MNSPNLTTVLLPPATGRSIGRNRADRALGLCPRGPDAASKLGKIQSPQMGRIHRPLRAKVSDETKNPPEARRLWPDLECKAAAKAARHVAADLRAALCCVGPDRAQVINLTHTASNGMSANAPGAAI